LREEKENLLCSNCGKELEIKDGIPILLNESSKEQIKRGNISEIFNKGDLEKITKISLRPLLYSTDHDTRVLSNYLYGKLLELKGNLPEANKFISRALELSFYKDQQILRGYLELQKQLGDVESAKLSLKRAGLRASFEGNIGLALELFQEAVRIHSDFHGIEDWFYDYEIDYAVRMMAEKYRERLHLQESDKKDCDKKIRIGYVRPSLHGLSSVTKIYEGFSRYHDKDTFDIYFYILEPKNSYMNILDHSKKAIRNIEKTSNLIFAPEGDTLSRIEFLAKNIIANGIHILVINTYQIYIDIFFLASLRIAPIMVFFAQSDQNKSDLFDHTIIFAPKRRIIDSTGPCSFVTPSCTTESELVLSKINRYRRKDFNLQEEDIVFISVAGRGSKFQSESFWRIINKILANNSHAYFLCVGANRNDIKIDLSTILGNVEEKVLFLGLREDVYELLGISDIYLDTFPIGGGLSLQEAMVAGLPVVAFKDDDLESIDFYKWGMSELVGLPEVLVEGNNFDEYLKVINRLIDDKDYRKQVGKELQKKALDEYSFPNAVRQIESIFKTLYEEHRRKPNRVAKD
jgi:predicted O-linked N-acetylglucosamine transferase (SPINDLY family)